jgi:hypothetical protein
MIRPSLLAFAAVAAFAAPILPDRSLSPALLPAWPARFDGRALEPLAPAPEDERLARDFPGRIKRFSDGRRQIVLHFVTGATRQLHPARDCFDAIGYAIAPAKMTVVPSGDLASCFEAVRGDVQIKVCERVIDARGRSFPDISSWYWPALLGQTQGPWMATTTVERLAEY